MVIDHDFPLVPAILVDSREETLSEIRAEFVEIDGHFERISNSSISVGLDSYQNRNHTNPQEEHHDHVETNMGVTDCKHLKVDSSKTVGAWAAGIVLGFAMGVGPSLSMAFGIGAAYYSSQEEGVAGDIARAFGDVALISHAKFIQVNQKHKIVDNLANGAVSFSRNCFIFTAKCRDKLFPTANQNSEALKRQTNTTKTETT